MAEHGIVRGTVHGLLHGIDRGNLLVGVAQDATSLKYVPADASQWTTVMAAASIASGNPTSLWEAQEASGDLADTIGSNTLTAFSNPQYQVAIAGWTRQAVHLDDNGDAFYNTSVGNTATTSYLILAYITLAAAPESTLPAINIGGGVASADRRAVAVTAASVYRAQGTGILAVDGVSDPGTDVRPVVLLFNRAGTEFSVLTDQDKIITAYVPPVDGSSAYLSFEGLGGVRLLYATMFSGAAAELSRAQVKALLQVLGWSVAWSP